MQIIGFNFKKISVERKKDIKGKLEVKTDLSIDQLEKDEISIAGDILRFFYTYSINYEPGYAEIVFKGEVLITPNNPRDIKKIMKEWKKKKISDDIRLFVFNFIMAKCNLKALQLEEELALPLHIPFPKLSRQQNQQQANYAG